MRPAWQSIVYGKDTPPTCRQPHRYLRNIALSPKPENGFTNRRTRRDLWSAARSSQERRVPDRRHGRTRHRSSTSLKNCYDNLITTKPAKSSPPRRHPGNGPSRFTKATRPARAFTKDKEAFWCSTLNTLEYRAQQKARFESLSASKSLTDVARRIRSVLSGQDRAAELAWKATALLFRIRRAASDRAASRWQPERRAHRRRSVPSRSRDALGYGWKWARSRCGTPSV